MSWPAGVRATQLGQSLFSTIKHRYELVKLARYHLGGPHLRAMTLSYLFSPGTQSTSPMPLLLAVRAITNR